MSDLDDLEKVFESTKFTTHKQKDGLRERRLGVKNIFATSKRSTKAITLATEPYRTDNHLNKDRRRPKITIDK